jgi:hypothetical protein
MRGGERVRRAQSFVISETRGIVRRLQHIYEGCKRGARVSGLRGGCSLLEEARALPEQQGEQSRD